MFSFENLLAVLGLAVIIVSLLRRLHLPPILGYLIAGVVVGPSGLGLLESKHQMHYIAEFGVVFLMFTIGLELSFPKLFAMRRSLLGLGGLQVLLCSAITIVFAYGFGYNWPSAFTFAGALSLSSTAVVTKLLLEQDELSQEHGKISLSILLFQDLAAVFFLILVPALAEQGSTLSTENTLFRELGMGVITFLIMLGIGRWLLRPLFHSVAQAKSSELFMLTVLLVVLAAAFLSEKQGLSLALGAFLAGVMLAETEYVHQIESDIQPFRDILLGLFFIAVGLSLNTDIILTHWAKILAILVSLTLAKAFIVCVLALATGSNKTTSIRSGFILAQGGEFGLFLLTQANDLKIMDTQSNQIILAVVVLSMALAPILIRKSEKLASLFCKNPEPDPNSVLSQDQSLEDHVIICGYGRVGQIQAKFLEFEGLNYVGVDLDTRLIKEARLAGEPVYYGDACDKNILLSAGLEKARLVILAIDNPSRSVKILNLIRHVNKDIPVLVRTPDDMDMELLKRSGATEVIPDQLESSLMLATHMLILLGREPEAARQQIWEFKTHRYTMLQGYYHGEKVGHLETNQDANNHLHAILISENAHVIDKSIEEVIGDLEIQIESFSRNNYKCEAPTPFTTLCTGDTLVVKGSLEQIYLCEEKLLRG